MFQKYTPEEFIEVIAREGGVTDAIEAAVDAKDIDQSTPKGEELAQMWTAFVALWEKLDAKISEFHAKELTQSDRYEVA